MAGKFGGFDKNAFEQGIHFVMQMGAPTNISDQATFYFAPTKSYGTTVGNQEDQEGVPFNPTIPLVFTPSAGIRVPCAVEYRDANGVVTDFGVVTPSSAVITFLDVDYQKIKGCSYVVLGGEQFDYRHTEFPVALFDAGVYTLHFISVDQN